MQWRLIAQQLLGRSDDSVCIGLAWRGFGGGWGVIGLGSGFGFGSDALVRPVALY